jgi:hypothetical protein
MRWNLPAAMRPAHRQLAKLPGVICAAITAILAAIEDTSCPGQRELICIDRVIEEVRTYGLIELRDLFRAISGELDSSTASLPNISNIVATPSRTSSATIRRIGGTVRAPIVEWRDRLLPTSRRSTMIVRGFIVGATLWPIPAQLLGNSATLSG